MKKILGFIFVLLFVFTFIDGAGVLAKEKFEYPITTSSEEWKEFTTRDQMIAATRIPEEILKDMTTEELVVALFEYPLLINVYAYNNNDVALRMFERDCDAFKELITRNDAAVVLNKYFDTIPKDDFLGIKASEVFSSSEKIFNETAQYEEDLLASIQRLAPSYSFVFTPNNSAIFVFNNDNVMSSVEVTLVNNHFIMLYPNATFVDNSSNEYNCHSYAWYSNSISNPWWMNKDYVGYNGAKEYMSDGSYTRVFKAYDASKVFFDTGDHSMRIYDAPTNNIYDAELISKWGAGPVMIHAVNYSPYSMTGYTMWN